jgi:serine phosphatase RsbU (regulator of sigma subunit)
MIEPAGPLEAPEPASRSWWIQGVRLSSHIAAAERQARGGDWCEAFSISGHVVALSIGDVCGHGEEKHAAMSAIRETIRDAACRGLDPARTLLAGHRFMQAFDLAEYATALFGLLNLRERTFTFANAGHPAPLMASPRETTFLEYAQCDLPLGIADPFLPALRTVSIPPATLLVFYTDGVTEHARKPLEGSAELREAAIFATEYRLLPAASVIGKQMFLTGSNDDDAAILTAWTPPPRRPFAR